MENRGFVDLLKRDLGRDALAISYMTGLAGFGALATISLLLWDSGMSELIAIAVLAIVGILSTLVSQILFKWGIKRVDIFGKCLLALISFITSGLSFYIFFVEQGFYEMVPIPSIVFGYSIIFVFRLFKAPK
jgi:hypothetical protein